jgi:hypothetical protein
MMGPGTRLMRGESLNAMFRSRQPVANEVDDKWGGEV